MTKRFINSPGMKPLGMYSHVTVVEGGKLAFISGQIGADAVRIDHPSGLAIRQ